jgi:hypothetical protein
MKSILDLLKEEDNLVRSIKRMESDLTHYKHTIIPIEIIDIGCDARDDDIKHYNELVDATEKAIASEHELLSCIREQIRSVIMGN